MATSDVAGTLKFLGTAGARFVVSTQLRHSGGLVWTLGGAQIWVDPGPGALVRALASRPRVDPARTDVLVVTHRHLDHAGDATAVVEAMTKGGFGRRGTLLAPRDALETEPVVFRYAQAFVARRAFLEPGVRHALAPGVTLETPLAHDHGVETYGYRIAVDLAGGHDDAVPPRPPLAAGQPHPAAPALAGLVAGHVVDTFWMDALVEAYAGVDLLVVNTTRERGGDRRYLHLGADEAERLVREIRPRLAVLTHLGMQLVRARPDRIALGISERTGVPTVAARDGWLLGLDDLGAAEGASRDAAPAP